jgi:hypothetical protein
MGWYGSSGGGVSVLAVTRGADVVQVSGGPMLAVARLTVNAAWFSADACASRAFEGLMLRQAQQNGNSSRISIYHPFVLSFVEG